MRIVNCLVVVAFALFSVRDPSAVAATVGDVSSSVVPLQVDTDGGEMRGTAVLIARNDRGEATTLYFLTSARLLRPPNRDDHRPAKAVRLRLDATHTLNIAREDVFVAGGFIELAIVRATTAHPTFLQPKPIVYDSPSPDAAFVLTAIDANGVVTSVPQHVRFASTIFVVGDRDSSGVGGCIGAPAISPEGVFGIVQECEPNRTPIISLLSLARSFVERNVPPQPTTTAGRP